MFRAADAFYARRREGPYRFIQNRSRISVVALKSDAAAEKPKDQLSRDFLGCSIFDFCNKICQKATWPNYSITSLAGASKFRGISRSSAFAVLRLITRSITVYLGDTSCLLNSARLVSLF